MCPLSPSYTKTKLFFFETISHTKLILNNILLTLIIIFIIPIGILLTVYCFQCSILLCIPYSTCIYICQLRVDIGYLEYFEVEMLSHTSKPFTFLKIL